ncbi:Leucine-rich repeat and WD repeat-containing protein 1 [Blattella germanica]|nr:Leucine-rich repeat and WD repeat-containing protein 1 [Blattella germanica]
MKRKLMYDDAKIEFDYDPIHFLRCHSRGNDPADIRTQVWHCAFEPDPDDNQRTTENFATCGGNIICFVNARKGKVQAKYTAKDLRELFYCVAWTTLPHANILVAGGARGTLHFLDPNEGIALLEQRVVQSCHVTISSLLFHPKQNNILFCGHSDGQVLVWEYDHSTPQLVHLITLEARSEVFALAFSVQHNILLAACNNGLRGWSISHKTLQNKSDNLLLLEFHFPNKGNGSQLVDSVEVLSDGLIATKCALHGAIYLWDLGATLTTGKETAVITHELRWTMRFLACGDDRGAIWLYDLEQEANEGNPTKVLQWPELLDTKVDHKRKLQLGVYDIVVDKVSVSWDGKFLVAATNNNMVCIWRRCS